jgi:hypothetical protein
MTGWVDIEAQPVPASVTFRFRFGDLVPKWASRSDNPFRSDSLFAASSFYPFPVPSEPAPCHESP